MNAISGAVPYWPRYFFNDTEIDLSHLNPCTLTCICSGFPRPLSIGVTYSNHCFTDHFQEGVHDPAWKIMDHRKERVFCFTRHGLSIQLPAMTQALPSSIVWQVEWGRNFMYRAVLDDGLGNCYPMFFNIRKGGTRGRDLSLFVESAYPISGAALSVSVKEPAKVKFATLCAKVMQGKAIDFRHR